MVICPAIVGRLACFRVALSRTLLAFAAATEPGLGGKWVTGHAGRWGGFAGGRAEQMIDDWGVVKRGIPDVMLPVAKRWSSILFSPPRTRLRLGDC
jgi:hypothetical protein